MLSYRIFKNAIIGLWRNKWLTVATVIVMTLALFTVGLFIIINILVNSTVDTVKSRIDLEVYFKKEVTADTIMAAQDDLKKLSVVKNTRYISPEEALNIFREQNKNDPGLLSAISEEENPLPASLKIDLYRAEDLDQLSKLFHEGKYDEITDSTSYENNKLIVQKLINIGNYVKKGGVALSLIFLLTTLIVVFNTIRINLYTRKEEIEIMRLVGATNWYIRWPFILEGSFYGLISVLLSSLVLFVGLKLTAPYLESYLQEFSANFFNYITLYSLQIIGLQIVISIAIGIISSTLAIRRYLKV
ncbi:ABC transporter permease [Candidatus Microgenomates bacterium]|nr:ABC transporter permease [Candidatus Microgenomates bacterium]